MEAPARPQNAHVGTSVQPQWVMVGTSVQLPRSHVETPVLPRLSYWRAPTQPQFALAGAPAQPQWMQMETTVQLLHSRARPPVLPIVDARDPLLDRVVLVREPLLNRVAFLAEKRGIPVTCVQKNSTRKAGRALCTACVVDSLSTTVTLGQSLEETKRWVNTSLKSNLRRRLTDMASQPIWSL